MPPPTKQMARSPMKRTAKKKSKRPEYPSAAQLAERAAWSHSFPECWVCGTKHGLQTHEIASRAQAPLKWADVRNYFRACGNCNCDFLNWCPEAVQMALKAIYDPLRYDRAFINELRHRATEAIGKPVVEWWEKLLRRERPPF